MTANNGKQDGMESVDKCVRGGHLRKDVSEWQMRVVRL